MAVLLDGQTQVPAQMGVKRSVSPVLQAHAVSDEDAVQAQCLTKMPCMHSV